MADQSYPIAFRHDVPARKSVFESMKSRLRDIPDNRSDYAVVLEVDGQHVLVPDGTSVANADGIRSANALLFVTLQSVHIDVTLKLKCRDLVEDRTVHVRFVSSVHSPEEVVRQRIDSIESSLDNWVRRLVGRTSRQYYVDETAGFEDEVWALLQQTLLENPPIPATALNLTVVDVRAELPIGLAEHEVAMVQKEREHKADLRNAATDAELFKAQERLRTLKAEAEDIEAERIEAAYERGVKGILALAAARDPEAINELALEGRRERALQLRAITAVLEAARGSDQVPQGVEVQLLAKLLENTGVDISVDDPTVELLGKRREVAAGGPSDEAGDEKHDAGEADDEGGSDGGADGLFADDDEHLFGDEKDLLDMELVDDFPDTAGDSPIDLTEVDELQPAEAGPDE